MTLLQQSTKVCNVLTVNVSAVPFHLNQINLPVTLKGAVYPAIPCISAVAAYPITAAFEGVQQQFLEGERVDLA
jgi:hypothetical protein